MNETKRELIRVAVSLALTSLVLFLIKDELSGWWLIIQGYFLFVFFYIVISPDTRPGRYFR